MTKFHQILVYLQSHQLHSCNMNQYNILESWRACSQRNESRSESRFGLRSASWLGSWFELRAFTCISNAVPIMNRICALRGNILFLLRRLTHAWLQRAFHFKCARTNHVLIHLYIHTSSESGFPSGSWSKRPLFCVSKACFKSLVWKSFAFTKSKIRLSNQERVKMNHVPKRLLERK